mmetsp:Transcript_14694/g.29256  ORF Transcript_14694/g.29256 Transcript_14694/m.29256 type:complete len:199 (-) Transcript_14694:71-667(-)
MSLPNFDFYVFALSWQPSFCSGNYGSYPGCTDPSPSWSANLTVHGMWPQYLNGTWPQDCAGPGLDPATPAEVGLDGLYLNWPNVKASVADADYADFWDHEWTKHGTCSGLDQLEYFSTALDVMPGTPEVVGSNVHGNATRAAIEGGYPRRVAVECRDGTYLSDVLVCLTKDTLEPMDCPGTVGEEGSCGDVVAVEGFQ